MAAYRRGDREASELLFSRVAPQIERYFTRIFGGRSVAKRMLWATQSAVHDAAPLHRIGMPPGPWVLTIAARVALRERRWQRSNGSMAREHDRAPAGDPRVDAESGA